MNDFVESGEFGIGIEEMSDTDSDIESGVNHSVDDEFDPGCGSFDPWNDSNTGS